LDETKVFFIIIDFSFCSTARAAFVPVDKNKKLFSVLFSFLSLARVSLSIHIFRFNIQNKYLSIFWLQK